MSKNMYKVGAVWYTPDVMLKLKQEGKWDDIVKKARIEELNKRKPVSIDNKPEDKRVEENITTPDKIDVDNIVLTRVEKIKFLQSKWVDVKMNVTKEKLEELYSQNK